MKASFKSLTMNWTECQQVWISFLMTVLSSELSISKPSVGRRLDVCFDNSYINGEMSFLDTNECVSSIFTSINNVVHLALLVEPQRRRSILTPSTSKYFSDAKRQESDQPNSQEGRISGTNMKLSICCEQSRYERGRMFTSRQ